MKYILIIFILLILFIILKKKERFDNNLTPFPIDIVYTWAGEKYDDDIRTRNNNELKFSLRSIMKYAPWVNRIFILMNPPKKKPSWFNEEYKKIITIIDHKETFPSNNYLPNTNSNAIETTLHNIPNLSEHFIYFNDDFFLGDYVKYTDFFTKDGKAIISNNINEKRKMLFGNDKLKINYPDMVSRFYHHIPYPFIKSEYKKYTEEYKDFINWIRSNKNRNGLGCDPCLSNNLHCPCQQFHYPFANYMYKNDKAIIKKILIKDGGCDENGYVNSRCLNYLKKFIIKSPKIFCIQDDGGIYNNENNKGIVNDFLKKKYNIKTFFEK